jgi:hypothetical protein
MEETFHFLYKDENSELYSKGINIPAKDMLNAVELFIALKPEAIILLVYSNNNCK